MESASCGLHLFYAASLVLVLVKWKVNVWVSVFFLCFLVAMAMLVHQVARDEEGVIGQNLRRRSFRYEAMLFIQNVHMVGNGFDDIQIVRCRDNGLAGLTLLDDKVHKP